VKKAIDRVRKLRDYDAAKVADKTATDCTDEPCIVQQGFADEADINNIVKRFGLTGQIPPAVVKRGVYGDFTGITDMESAIGVVARAAEGFAALPPEAREKFDNDLARFSAFVAGATDAQLVEYGLVPVAAAEATPAPPVVPPVEVPAG